MANQFNRERVAKVTYDFSVDGGAVSTIIPVLTDTIPTGAIVTGVFIDVTTDFTTSSSGTLALWIGDPTTPNTTGVNIVTAATPASFGINTGTVKKALTMTSSATAIKNVAPTSNVRVKIATGACTQGKGTFIITYLVP